MNVLFKKNLPAYIMTAEQENFLNALEAEASLIFISKLSLYICEYTEGAHFIRNLIAHHILQFPRHKSSAKLFRQIVKHNRLKNVWLASNVFSDLPHHD